MTYNIDNYNINVIITRKKNNKNIYLRIKEDLNLYITANNLISDKEIEKVIKDNESSIRKMLNKQIIKNNNNSGFKYFGKDYDVILINENKVIFGENKVFIGKNIDVDKYLKKIAKNIFLDKLNYWYNNFTYNIPYPSLRIRKMTSRWGVCNYKDNIVTLNLELIKKDISCLDYVIVHELSHLVHHDHSKSFWQVVEENYPNYKFVRKEMKNY